MANLKNHEKKQQILNQLIKMTERQPLQLRLRPDRELLEEVASEYNGNYIVTPNAIINKEQFKNFLLGELIDIFDSDIERHSITKTELYYIIQKSLLNFYNYLDELDWNNLEAELFWLIEDVLKWMNSKLLSNGIKFELESSEKDFNFYGIEPDVFTLLKKEIGTISLERAIVKIILRLPKKTMEWSRLCRELNRVPDNIRGINKPIDPQNSELLKQIKSFKSLAYSYNDHTVTLADHKYSEVYEDLIKRDNNNKVLEQDTFYSEIQNSGIVGIVYNGDEFLIENAIEYVRVRPLIFIKYTDNITTTTEQFLNPSENNWLEVHQIIYAFLKSGNAGGLDRYNSVQEWIRKYTDIAIFRCSQDEGEKIAQEILWAYLPVLNYSDNPDNIVKASIQKELQELNG